MLEDMQIRNLAVKTQESYVQQVSLFARYFNQSPERLGPEQIRAYQVYLISPHRDQQSVLDVQPARFVTAPCSPGGQAHSATALLAAGPHGSPKAGSGGHLPPLW